MPGKTLLPTIPQHAGKGILLGLCDFFHNPSLPTFEQKTGSDSKADIVSS